MNQIANIFRKDLRHHWREALVSLALVIGYAWVQVRGWSDPAKAYGIATGESALFEILSQLIVPLVPISWMFLVVRSVQGESLVGDRQFWVTRPYDWKKLLTTKIVFVLLFVNVPLFLLDIFLLAKAGFRPSSYLLGLLWLQCFWILVVLLPTAVLATVTASIGQMLLALLFVALYFIGLAALGSVVPNSSFSGGFGSIQFLLLFATAIAVILVQYSRRNTALSRWLIASLGILVALIVVVTPYRRLIMREYPLATTVSSPLQISLLPARAPDEEHTLKISNFVPLRFPLSVTGLPADSFIQVNGVIITLANAQGESWDSGWEPRGTLLFADQKTNAVELYVKRPEFEKFKSAPVRLHLLFAFTTYQERNRRQMTVPSGEFSISDLGVCVANARGSDALRCRVPLHGPEFLLFTSDLGTSPCPLPKGQTRPQPGTLARGSVRGNSGPAEPGISPIHDESVYLSAPSQNFAGICPGTQLTLTNPEQTGRNRIELDGDHLSLPDYQQSTTPPND